MQSTCYSCQIVIKHKFARHILENSQIYNFMKIGQGEAELFYADRRTKRGRKDEANSDFSQFCDRA